MKGSGNAVIVIGAVALVLASPRLGNAQPVDSSVPAASSPRFDVVFSLGGYRLNLREGHYLGYVCNPPPNCYDIEGRPEPYTWAAQIGAGFYSSEHLKTEVAVAWTASSPGGPRSDVYDRERVVTSSYTKSVYLLHNYDIHRGSISQLYQFRAGKRWRPYVGVAIGVDRETTSDSRQESFSAPLTEAQRRSWIQSGVKFSDTDRLPTSFPPPVTTTHVHVFGRAGFKAGSRVFFVLEMERGSRVAPLRAGLGIDLF